MAARINTRGVLAVAALASACAAVVWAAWPGQGRASSASASATPALARIGTFRDPVYVTAPPADRRRIFVVEQGGVIRVVRKGHKLGRPFLDVSGKIIAGGEQGLLSMAFAPDYASSRRFYIYYTNRQGDTRVVEYKRSRSNANRARAGSARVMLTQSQPESNHNGGQLEFGPDGLLYIGLGDGGGANDEHGALGNAQSLRTKLGKLLRINPRPRGSAPYQIPASNPFRGRAGAKPEIYAYGLRNPWRFSFDRKTGDLNMGDVGQNAWEEVDFARRSEARGVNYGWRVFEGNHRDRDDEQAPGHVAPVLEYSHDGGGCAVTGGYVVRDPGLPSLAGRYVYGDYCRGRLRSARLAAGGATGDRSLGLQVDQLSSFGEDARGRVYVVSLDGPVYRLTAR